MAPTIKRMVWSVALLLGAVSEAGAECPDCKWSDRGDRFEGVKSRQVSAGAVELLGVQYQRKGQVKKDAPKVYLHFRLPAVETLQIVVWEPATNYLMMPKERKLGQGRQHYAWPRGAVIAPLGLELDALYPKVCNPAKLYFPALLSTDDKPSPTGDYLFTLASSGGVAATCTVEREVEGRLAAVRSFACGEDFGGVFRVQWDGRDDAGKPVPEGVYVLRLKGTVEAETIDRLNFTVSFQHYGRAQ